MKMYGFRGRGVSKSIDFEREGYVTVHVMSERGMKKYRL